MPRQLKRHSGEGSTAEGQLGASRALMQAIFDNSPDWLTLFRATPDGRFVYEDMNRATETAYGLGHLVARSYNCPQGGLACARELTRQLHRRGCARCNRR